MSRYAEELTCSEYFGDENLKYSKFEKLSLKRHPELNERWVQDRIAEDPAILGLGDVVLKDKERIQPRAGRLDLLLQDIDTNRRYEVEVQLGATDESHIIRTIEYWDIERKRYPQYDHVAVIVAENITSRFLNVISLFNGTIPLIAIQINALQIDDNVGLHFTTVVDLMTRGLVEEDEETQEATDRSYWENRATKKTLEMADEILEISKQFDPRYELKYNKFYIGLSIDNQPKNFVTISPKKGFLRMSCRLDNSEETTSRLEGAGIDVEYNAKNGTYRIRLKPGEIKKHEQILTEIVQEAHLQAAG